MTRKRFRFSNGARRSNRRITAVEATIRSRQHERKELLLMRETTTWNVLWGLPPILVSLAVVLLFVACGHDEFLPVVVWEKCIMTAAKLSPCMSKKSTPDGRQFVHVDQDEFVYQSSIKRKRGRGLLNSFLLTCCASIRIFHLYTFCHYFPCRTSLDMKIRQHKMIVETKRKDLPWCIVPTEIHFTRRKSVLDFAFLYLASSLPVWIGTDRSWSAGSAENSKSPDVMTGFFSLFLSYAQFWRPLSWRRTQTNLIYTRASY